MRKTAFILIISFLTLFPMEASARDIKFEASLDNTEIAMGEGAQLGLTFYGTQDLPAPDIGNIDGFDVRYLGPSTMMTVINGRISSSVTHLYRLVPLRVGRFQIGPFSFNYKGDSYTSNIIFAEVNEARKATARPVSSQEEYVSERQDLKDRLFLTLEAGKARAYTNELIPVVVKLYVNRMNLSDIQLPVFAQEGFSKVDFKEPKQYRDELNGVLYDVLEFKTNIFGTKPGEYSLGPAKIKCNLVVKKRTPRMSSPADDYFDDEFTRDPYFEDFFTRYERHPVELKSDSIPITVLPLPGEGKPPSFSGAVGDYQFIFNASPVKLKAGDPITLKMEINGAGNFNTVLAPMLENTTGFKIYEPQVKTEANSKTFKQVIIPETENLLEVPKAIFSYFEPKKGAYRTITQGPIAIQVEKSPDQGPAQVVGPSVSGRPSPAPLSGARDEPARDIIYIKEKPGSLETKRHEIYRNNAYLAIVTLPLLFLAVFYIFYSRSARLRRDGAYARRSFALRSARRGFKRLRRQLKSDDRKIFYETLFKTLQDYLGARMGMPPAGITFNAVDSVIMEKALDMGMRSAVKSLFDICDQAKFAFFDINELRMRNDFANLEKVIRYFDRIKL